MNSGQYDCILIPGGGLLPDGSLPAWTAARLERALSLNNQTDWFGLLSGGTIHKPAPRNKKGFTLFESRQAAAYLAAGGIKANKLLTEICSYDTIGNAYYSRLLIAEPFSLTRLHVITSDFHLPRTKAIFKWIYSLAPLQFDFQLSFDSTPDQGLSESALRARVEREKKSLQELQPKIKAITTLEVFHHWLYTEHAAYATGLQLETLSPEELISY